MSDCWESYVASHNVFDYQLREVEKALGCYGYDNGCFVYYCPDCGEYIFQSMGCNSRLCSCCGKRYADQWAVSLSSAMFSVPHRHFVISVPDVIWQYLRDWKMMKAYMDAAIATCNDYFPKLMRNRKARVGVIVVLHPFRKDVGFQPHLHLIITEGAFDQSGRFVKQEFVPARKFARCWQYHVLKNLQQVGLPNEIATLMYEKYDGFYVWVHKRGRIHHPKLIVKYVGRYVRHPAIANSRITSFDGKLVKFFYINNEDVRVDVEMTVEQFITALIQHIPPPQFKMIRYYGAYARGIKGKYGAKVQSSIKQLNLAHFGFEKINYCPYCHHKLEFVAYCRKPPPPNKEKLEYWIETYSEKTKN